MIRLSRTGKHNSPHYSIVVTEKTNPASDGNFVEKLGYFNPTGENPVFEVKADRVKHWVSQGARPTETMARLLHKEGFEGMDRFVDFKKKYQKKSKSAPAEEEAAPAAEAPAEGGEGGDTGEEAAPAAEEKPAEEPAAEEKPAEEKPAEEEKSSE